MEATTTEGLAVETGAEIKYSTLVRAEAGRAYDAIATGEGIDGWWGTDGAVVDARPGGEIRFPWKDWGPDRVTMELAGDVVEAVRPERFIYKWYYLDSQVAGGMRSGKFTTVELLFEQREDGTVVHLREYGYPGTLESYKNILEVACGWGEALTLLKFYVEHGVRY